MYSIITLIDMILYSDVFSGDFRFANYYGDHMVLQGSPGSATVWGYTPNVGDQVTVEMGQSSVVVTSQLGEMTIQKYTQLEKKCLFNP